jgi:DNA-binding transcriptional regulator LsrR (DeoR family)
VTALRAVSRAFAYVVQIGALVGALVVVAVTLGETLRALVREVAPSRGRDERAEQ